jgi:hypothetical protein
MEGLGELAKSGWPGIVIAMIILVIYIFKAYHRTVISVIGKNNEMIIKTNETMVKVGEIVNNNTEALKDLRQEIRSRGNSF